MPGQCLRFGVWNECCCLFILCQVLGGSGQAEMSSEPSQIEESPVLILTWGTK